MKHGIRMISPKITKSHSTGRATRARIGRKLNSSGYDLLLKPYLPVNVPPNNVLQLAGATLIGFVIVDYYKPENIYWKYDEASVYKKSFYLRS